MRMVIDSNIITKWIFVEDLQDEAFKLLWYYQGGKISLVAPTHFPLEMVSIVYHKRKNDKIPLPYCHDALERINHLIVDIHSIIPLGNRIIEIAELINESAWDAAYLAVAEAEGCVFWTADQVLAKRARKHFSFIRLLGEDDPETDMNHDNSD